MRHGKIILSAASLVVAVAGMLAFKSSKVPLAKQCYTTISSGNGSKTAVFCWTTRGTGVSAPCQVGTANLYTLNGSNVTGACTVTH